jgi:hypothetical protein
VFSAGTTIGIDKLTAIWERSILKNKHEIRSFLGLHNYYRWFMSGLAKVVVEKQAFQWTPEVEALCTAPTVAYSLLGERFLIDTDTSNVGSSVTNT